MLSELAPSSCQACSLFKSVFCLGATSVLRGAPGLTPGGAAMLTCKDSTAGVGADVGVQTHQAARPAAVVACAEKVGRTITFMADNVNDISTNDSAADSNHYQHNQPNLRDEYLQHVVNSTSGANGQYNPKVSTPGTTCHSLAANTRSSQRPAQPSSPSAHSEDSDHHHQSSPNLAPDYLQHEVSPTGSTGNTAARHQHLAPPVPAWM